MRKSLKLLKHKLQVKYLKVGNTKEFDTNFIYTRVIGLQASSRDIDINVLLAHELAPVPTSMQIQGHEE